MDTYVYMATFTYGESFCMKLKKKILFLFYFIYLLIYLNEQISQI